MLSSGCQGKASIHAYLESLTFESYFESNQRVRGTPFLNHTPTSCLESARHLTPTPGLIISTQMSKDLPFYCNIPKECKCFLCPRSSGKTARRACDEEFCEALFPCQSKRKSKISLISLLHLCKASCLHMQKTCS